MPRVLCKKAGDRWEDPLDVAGGENTDSRKYKNKDDRNDDNQEVEEHSEHDGPAVVAAQFGKCLDDFVSGPVGIPRDIQVGDEFFAVQIFCRDGGSDVDQEPGKGDVDHEQHDRDEDENDRGFIELPIEVVKRSAEKRQLEIGRASCRERV